jgi:hypothetical protein
LPEVQHGDVATLVRSLRRDPDHFAERAMRLAVQRLGQPSWEWAQRVRGEDRAAEAERHVRQESLRIARVDGAVSGTPFLLALVPAYVAVLWQQARMAMRIAALRGRDPRDPGMVAELLALRGVHPTPEAAAEVLRAMKDGPAPREGHRPLRTWIELVRRVLVLAGFMSPAADAPRPSPARRAATAFVGGAVWVCTWVFPITFMVLMAWTCESATRTLANRVDEFYGGAPAADVALPRRARLARVAVMAVGLVFPLGLIAAAASARGHGHPLIWVSVLASITGLALVAGLAMVARR